MDHRKLVLKETLTIAIGELICSGVMILVFALLGKFRMQILWSALAGSLFMTLNYFFMAITVNLAADKAEAGQVEQGKKLVQISSLVRLLLLGGALFLAIKLKAHVLALLLPLAFSRPILMVAEFFGKKGD